MDRPSRVLHLDAPEVARTVLRQPDGPTRLPFRNEPAAFSRLKRTLRIRGANR
jgi:hypothetical protein